MLALISVAPETFLAVIGAAALAGTVAAMVTGRGIVVPVVVIELLFGVLLGPQVLGFHINQFIAFFSDLGLGMLFFFAGYEIDLHRIQGQPLRLALLGWAFRSRSRTRSATYSRRRASCCRCSTRALRARLRRSARSSRSFRTPVSCARASAPICSRLERWESSARSCCSR